jgi:peptidoglycan-associated lipoprotein
MFRWFPILGVLAACHHDTTTKTTPVPPPAAPPPLTKQVMPVQQEAPPVAVSQNLQAGTDLLRQCELHASSSQEAAPKFGFDEAELTVQDRTVLQLIAECVTRGPLRGKNLQLVGRADPRGTEEYNMGLGDRRAHSVSTYLERLGVSSAALTTATRGALDANSGDETTWQRDRRVDVEVAN